MPRGRPKKGGGPQSGDFQILAMLKELGFSKEEFVDLVTKAKKDREGAIDAAEQREGVTEIREEITSVNMKSSEPNSGRRSWAEVVEEEEQSADPHIGNPKEPSWADITKANWDPQGGAKLPFVEPTEVITFTEAEIHEGARMWERSLIGMVVGSSPSYGEILKFVRANWKDYWGCKIHQVRRGIFLFDFQSEDAKNRVLNEKWQVYNRFPLVLKPWSPGMNLEACFERIPVWIQLPGLSLDLWTPKNLGKLVSFVGKPIMTDSFTARGDRIGYARVLVGVYVGGKLPEYIPVCCAGKEYKQRIVYEWVPVVCGKCGWFGHGSDQCRRDEMIQKRKNMNQVKKGVNQTVQPQGEQPVEKGKQNVRRESRGDGGTSSGGGEKGLVIIENATPKSLDDGFTLVTRKGNVSVNKGNGVVGSEGIRAENISVGKGGMTTLNSHG